MGNRKAREFLQKQEQQASWDRLRTQPWRPDGSGYRAFGSGHPRVQLLWLPSFDAGAFFEICQHNTEWLLYRAAVVGKEDWPAVMVQGYDRVDFPAQDLRRYFERLTSLSLPLVPLLNNMAGLDGAITQLALFGDLHSEVRFRWWSEPPPTWAPLVAIANEMLRALGCDVEPYGFSESG